MKPFNRFFSLLIILCMMVLVSCGKEKFVSASNDSEIPSTGQKAPDFTLKTTDGKTVTLSSALNKPVLLNFWATWCGPCVGEMPSLQRLHQEMGDQIQVIGIDLEESPSVVGAFIQQKNLTYTFLLDNTGNVGYTYRISAIPTSIAINKQGIITAHHVGSLSYDDIKKLAQTALGK